MAPIMSIVNPSARLAALLALAIPSSVIVGCATTTGEAEKAKQQQADRPRVFDSSRAETELALMTGSEPDLAAAGIRRMEVLMAREAELTGWVLPLLQSYLPPGSKLPSRVYLAAKLPEPISAHADAVFVDVASPTFGEDDEALWNDIVRAIYRQALTAVLVQGKAGEDEFTNHLLSRLQLEGLVAYVAAQGRPNSQGSSEYDALESRAEATERFGRLDDAFRDVRRGDPEAKVIGKLDAADAKESLYAVVGGAMALAIERQGGREGLVDSMTKGPAAFYDAYQKTGPGALVNFRVPGSTPSPSGELSLPPDAAH